MAVLCGLLNKYSLRMAMGTHRVHVQEIVESLQYKPKSG